MALPYENSTSGKNAISEIQKILLGFGASSFGYMEDFATGDLIVQFAYRDRRVSVRANAKGYAAAWLKEHPHTHRTRGSRQQHEEKALRIGKIAVYSILRDWIKGQITAVEVGMMSFEGAFLGQLLLPDGQTVLEKATTSGLLQITDERGEG
ncbi:hypothetical protein [Oceaniradius stylonematis]|uniref:hypothetical protein n=1 Tax=Oceaniradius stylonematis TaxID=2184161 RepID=UPI00273E8157|nr:hypothetical protein [Oceaniradius stylonematis]